MAALGDDLLNTVNKLQDLVFNTIGNDSLDLPQIVCFLSNPWTEMRRRSLLTLPIGCRWFSVFRQIFCPRKHRRTRLSPKR